MPDASQVVRHLESLAFALKRYQELVEYFAAREPGSDVGSAKERSLIFVVRGLLDELDVVRVKAYVGPPGMLGNRAERDIKRLSDILRGQIDKWGWSDVFSKRRDVDRVVGAQPGQNLEVNHIDRVVGQRLERIDKKFRKPFLEVNLAASESLEEIAVGDDPHMFDSLVDHARARGMTPSKIDAEKFPEEWRRRLRAWREASILGKELPKPIEGDARKTREILGRITELVPNVGKMDENRPDWAKPAEPPGYKMRPFDPREHEVFLRTMEGENRMAKEAKDRDRGSSAKTIKETLPKLRSAISRLIKNEYDLEAFGLVIAEVREVQFQASFWARSDDPNLAVEPNSPESRFQDALFRLVESFRGLGDPSRESDVDTNDDVRRLDKAEIVRRIDELSPILDVLSPTRNSENLNENDVVESTSEAAGPVVPHDQSIPKLKPHEPKSKQYNPRRSRKPKELTSDQKLFLNTYETGRFRTYTEALEACGLYGKIKHKDARRLVCAKKARTKRQNEKSVDA